ncbi:zinc ribbon domain-containing protein [Flintibacter sp.]
MAKVSCPYCGHSYDMDDPKCPYCGAKNTRL